MSLFLTPASIYIFRTRSDYEVSAYHPKWSKGYWGDYRWRQASSTCMCVREGNKLLRTLGVKPLRPSEVHVLIQLSVNPQNKVVTVTEWEWTED